MPPSLRFRSCSAVVIKCFKRVEAAADWLTGAAGPFFVALCWFMIVGSGVAFFDVVFRSLGVYTMLVLSPVLILLPLNLYGNYYLVTHVPPGFPAPTPTSSAAEQKWLIPDEKSIWWATPRKGRKGWRRLSTVASKVGTQSVASDLPVQETSAVESDGQKLRRRRLRRCRKCDGPKPERTHHCRVCKRCVLLMDHHCPWINNCVGLHNYRYFILFMVYLSLSCWTVVALGFRLAWVALELENDEHEWHALITPRIAYILAYVLCVAIGVAVPVLLSWHLYLISHGETSIESHDNAYLEDKAASDGLTYVNPYDLGSKKNFELFFNVGPEGYPLRTLLFPQVVPPYTAGWEWERVHSPLHGLRPNREQGYVVGDRDGEDALTDDETGGGGWIEVDDPRMPPGTSDENRHQ